MKNIDLDDFFYGFDDSKCTKKEERVGKMGEYLVSNLLNLDCVVDQYDPRFDMINDDFGINAEVKTQVRHYTKRMFTTSEKHIPKCTGVYGATSLIFVDYHSLKDPGYHKFIPKNESDVITISLCPDKMNFQRFTTKTGYRMIGWGIDGMIPLMKIRSKFAIDYLRKNTSSGA